VWEAPVFTERTSVGLDVPARSVVAAAIDGVTGEADCVAAVRGTR
jgi:transposase